VDVGADPADAFQQRNILRDVLLLREPLDTAEVETDLERSADDFLTLAL